MSRLTPRSAMTALVLGVAALGGSALASSEASAKGFHGGWGKHHHHGWHRRHWGPTFVSYGVYPVVYGGCFTRRLVTFDGSVIIKKRCY